MQLRRSALILSTLAALSVAAPSQAQGDPNYAVGAGDVLQIKVPRHAEFEAKALIVPETGIVELPVLGALKVTGKTLTQIDADITKLLATQVGRPEVDVVLVKTNDRFILVNGQVAKPGRWALRERWRITEALTASGGLKIASDRVSVSVIRGGRKLVDVPAQAVISNPISPDNLRLQAGDRLEVTANSVQVTVSGEVPKPGVISAPLNSGVLDIIDLAGGATEEAALNRVILTPAVGKARTLDLRRPPSVTTAPVNFRVMEGDTLTIPALKFHISILGAVRKPGFYGVEEGRKLFITDALKRAGGTSPRALLRFVKILHADGRLDVVDLTSVTAPPIELFPDDVLTVPVAKEVTIEGEVTNPGKQFLLGVEEPRVTNALDAAGGLKRGPEDSRISVVRLLGKRKVELRVDVKALLVDKDVSQNVLIQDGDILKVVPGERLMVALTGEVTKTGVIDLRPGQRLSVALQRAGGPTKWAALSEITILRREAGGRVEVDGNAALKPNSEADVELLDGDLITVGRLDPWVLATADGITTEFPYPEKGGLTLEAALEAAKVQKLEDGAKYTLLRRGPDGVRKITIDSRSKNTQGSGMKTLLQAGDTLMLPLPQKPR